jgi:hypothetical protein
MDGLAERVARIEDSLCDWHPSILRKVMEIRAIESRMVLKDASDSTPNVIGMHANFRVVFDDAIDAIENGSITSHPSWILAAKRQNASNRKRKHTDYRSLSTVLDINIVKLKVVVFKVHSLPSPF